LPGYKHLAPLGRNHQTRYVELQFEFAFDLFEKEIRMTEKQSALKRTSVIAAVLIVAVASIAIVKTTGQEETKANASAANEQWEYLAVAGPSTTNLTPTGNPRMRKEPSVPFAREAFVLEQHLDKLGASGWELIAVAGPPTDPAYYFKRRK
jgi:hypothetical protein